LIIGYIFISSQIGIIWVEEIAKFKFASPIPEDVIPINLPDSLNKAPPELPWVIGMEI